MSEARAGIDALIADLKELLSVDRVLVKGVQGVMRRHDYKFNRFPRDMEKEPPKGDGERWEAFAFHVYSQLAETLSRGESILEELEDALGPAPRRPQEPDEEVIVAMLAATEAVICHLWDVAARFDTTECNAIRDPIHRLNTLTIPAIRDLQAPARRPQHGDVRTCPDCKHPDHQHQQRFVQGHGWAHASIFEWLSEEYAQDAIARRSPEEAPPVRREDLDPRAGEESVISGDVVPRPSTK